MLGAPLPSRSSAPPRADGGGAQSIRRALQVLRYVASRPEGARLNEVARACALNKATCHRILSALASEHFLHFDRPHLRYRLGLEAVLIGWSARERQDIQALAERGMTRISEATGDTVFLSVRSGHEAVCIDRRAGDFPIKTLTLDIGTRRPLGVGSGSMALLAFLPPDEVEEILEAVEPRLSPYRLLSKDILRRKVLETRAQGFSFNDERVIEGMSAVGVPVFGEAASPVAALSVAAITSRMSQDRRREIVAMLQAEAAELSRTLLSGSAGPVPRARAGGRGGGGRSSAVT